MRNLAALNMSSGKRDCLTGGLKLEKMLGRLATGSSLLNYKLIFYYFLSATGRPRTEKIPQTMPKLAIELQGIEIAVSKAVEVRL